MSMSTQRLSRADADRLALLERAPLDKWIALSQDETRIVAEGATYAEVVAALNEDEDDPIVLRVPEDWTPRKTKGRSELLAG
jgi:hypothetical protein